MWIAPDVCCNALMLTANGLIGDLDMLLRHEFGTKDAGNWLNQ